VGDILTLGMIVSAFAGGAFGAAIGALPAFAFTGVLVIAGEVVAISAGGETPTADITGAIAFGPIFGPHVSFGGGAAAAAYAVKRGYIEPDFVYHPAKYITSGLGTRLDILAVGGLFGVFGHLSMAGSELLSIPWDPVAFGVVISALAHRIAFGYTIIGSPQGGWFDMSPFERAGAESGVEPWLPHQYRWSRVAGLGIVVGIVGAYIAFVTGSAFLAFGISAASLLYINVGVERIPVTHHMTLPASTAVIAAAPEAGSAAIPELLAASIGLMDALVLGAAFGLLGAILGEVVQRIAYAHAETHLDPPAASIVLTTLIIAGLSFLGVFAHAAWIPTP